MAMLSSVSSNAAKSVRVGTNAASPWPICAVEIRAKRNVAMKVLREYLIVGSARNQRRNRGENWLDAKLDDEQNDGGHESGKREHAAAERGERCAGASGTDGASEDDGIGLVPPQSPTLSASARTTYTQE